MQTRLDESARLGFTQAVIPKVRTETIRPPQGFKLIQLGNLREGLEKFYLVE